MTPDPNAAAPARPSGEYTRALDRVADLAGQRADLTMTSDVAGRMAEQLRSRFHQEVRDAITMQELGALIAETPALHDREIPTITIQEVIDAMKQRADR